MTLKSLNSRYVKLIRKTAVMGVGLLLIISLLGLSPRDGPQEHVRRLIDLRS